MVMRDFEISGLLDWQGHLIQRIKMQIRQAHEAP